MKVGDIYKLKVECLGNKVGALGVVFNVYDGGFQVIFEDGQYDGFAIGGEAEIYLEQVGHDDRAGQYRFKNVIKLSEDYRMGAFSHVFSA